MYLFYSLSIQFNNNISSNSWAFYFWLSFPILIGFFALVESFYLKRFFKQSEEKLKNSRIHDIKEITED